MEKLNNILDKIKKNNNSTNITNVASNSAKINHSSINPKNSNPNISAVVVGSSNGSCNISSNKANNNSTHCKIQTVNSNGASTSCRLILFCLPLNIKSLMVIVN